MALKALDIYKLLPKKNCKECGDPTCLTFAMKLAQGKVEPDLCPYLDEEAKNILGASTRPPIQKVTVGMGTLSFTVGEEFVFYRHEKTFYHQPGIMYSVSDTESDDRIREVVSQVRGCRLTRIGIDLVLNGLAVYAESRSPERFAAAITVVTQDNPDLPLVLMASDPAVMEAGLAICGNYLPLIRGVNDQNCEAFCTLAKKYGAPLVVSGNDPEQLAANASRCTGLGITQLMLDLSGTEGEFIRASTLVRQAALARSVPGLGYPVFLDVRSSGFSGLITGITKFASVIVTRPLTRTEMQAALVMRQNIYTDPQKPIQMTPGLYRVGSPGRDDPVFLTVNFSLTYFTLQGYLESTRRSCWLLIVDTEGMSVLTAVAAGKLSESVVKDAIEKSGLASEVNHKTIIIPGYASPLSGRIEEYTGWKVIVGPRDAAEIASFIEEELK
ncbi:MAG: acetyl-CoA decarbonylase/synthase complex subunit gamma [Methanospirillum sp.]|uniref:acetyl-CoA decarbonylase/synthase complex subunit gamma n=1 Tax=Methanospirillum sp. TaxID=45200 RepID=UPI002369ACD6|nr:acetyl-CoA decarbonylase/synthase complex subunit gamma [Methanospirillum sp.]MDD1727862.1 acetyl-CoA decarbonylase/synthase complex subunit gamma [Methanospirillum sp.]